MKEYPAHITEVNSDGTYTVVFDDDCAVLWDQKVSDLRAMQITAGGQRRSNRRRTMNAAVAAVCVARPKQRKKPSRCGPTVQQLHEELSSRGLSTRGKKAVLFQRLAGTREST